MEPTTWLAIANGIASLFKGIGGGASAAEKAARRGAILQESWKPCPPGYYAAKYSGPNKNTVQCYVDPNYRAPVAAPEPEPEPALPAPVPEPSPATPTPEPPATPAPPAAPRPGDSPLVAQPGALDWDTRAYGAGILLTKVKGKLPKLPALQIQKGGLPQTVPGSKVKRVSTIQYKGAEAIKEARDRRVWRDPLVKPREMPRVDLPKGRTPTKITALGAAARAGNIIGLILAPGKLGNADLYRDPYPVGQPVRSNRTARDQSDRGKPISAASKARLERIGVLPRSTPDRAARKLPIADELGAITIGARRVEVPAARPARAPERVRSPAPAPVARPVSTPTRTPRTPITWSKPDWMQYLELLRPRGKSGTTIVQTLPIYLTTPTPTSTSSPTSTPKADPLTSPQADPLVSPVGPGYTPPTGGRTDQCDCKSKKRKPRKPRTECYKGSYVESATGLKKTKREKVSCQ